MKTLLATALLLASFPASADSFLPFGRDWAGDRDLPRPYGVGFDLFSLDQEYDIADLSFTLPGVTLPDPSVIEVRNDVRVVDVKFDAWLLPFLNIFGLFGQIDADTYVNLGAVPIPQLGGITLGTLPIRYSGQVYGGGMTLAYGGEHWFASLTGTYVDTDLSGDFESTATSRTWQPRVGLIKDQWQFWVGGLYLDTEEEHSGVIALPFLGDAPFAVSLSEKRKFNPSAGARFVFTEYLDLTMEFGGGNRTTTLLNLTARFE